MNKVTMGDIAEMILDGILDEQTGEYIDDEISRNGGCGYPRTIHKRKQDKLHNNNTNKDLFLGGRHLVGKEKEIAGLGFCKIVNYGGKRGRKRYTVRCKNGFLHKIKFSRIIFKT